MPQGDADITIGVLVEDDADLIVLAPDRVAVAREMIAIDLKRELRWQSGRIGNVNARAARGDVPHRAVDGTAIAKRQPSPLNTRCLACVRRSMMCSLIAVTRIIASRAKA